MKICSTCKILKPYSSFYKGRNRADGYQYKCIICDNRSQKERYQKNRTKVLKKCWTYRNIVNPDYQKSYRKSHRNQRKIYEVENRHIIQAACSAYRARKLNATPKWLSREHKGQIKQLYKNCPLGYEVDHIIPLKHPSICGLHVPWNLQYLTFRDNRIKGNRETI